MAETAIRREPLDDAPSLTVRRRIAVEPAGPSIRFVLRGSEQAAADLGAAFGVALPTAINSAAGGDGKAALRLGPDEWLLLAPEEGEGGADALAARLGAGTGEPHSLVDVSHRNVGLVVSGALATDVLSTGVMLDLDPAAFPVGMATRTLFAKAEIVLWRQEETRFHVEVWRSFSAYLHGLLGEAVREYVKP
jgi:sarcosine oxidase subunit gamma